MLLLFFSSTYVSSASEVSGTIDTGLKYAWGENMGWLNFAATGGSITVTDSALTGDVWNDNYGWINLSPTSGGVTNNGEGTLEGSAWSSGLGWIDFSGVSIDSSGRFHGTASGVLSGTVTFDCAKCAVQTDWRPASVRTVSSSASRGGGGNAPIAPAVDSSNAFTVTLAPPPLEQTTNSPTESPTQNIVADVLRNVAAASLALFDVTLSSEGLRTTAAPGESIAFSVKLSNFGSENRADVTIFYRLFDNAGREIYAESETVAVDTTASFVKRIPIPRGTVAGVYTIETSLSYIGQEAPAVSRFTFNVAPHAPIMNSRSIYFAGIGFAVLSMLGIWYIARMRVRSRRGILHDYADTPSNERIYYEMVSDIITQMRLRVGDQALEVAIHIDGLVIDRETGRVLKITQSPAQVVAGLIAGYEKVLGKKVSFSLRTGGTL